MYVLSTFYRTLSDILQLDTVHLILGDFNINAQDQNLSSNLQQLLQNYQQLVEEPTHLGGDILDHIYVNKTLFNKFKVDCFLKCVYFSDHDAIKVKFSLKM